MFFWQTSEEVEEEIEAGKVTPAQRRDVSKTELKWMRTDVVSGMLLSNGVMWTIMLTAASTLFNQGIHRVESAAQAAQMLRPVSGEFAYALFAAGITTTGLLAAVGADLNG